MKLLFALTIAAASISCPAQASHQAEVFSSAQTRDQLAQLAQRAKADGSSDSTLGNYGTHALKLSERTASGGAEIHGHFDDIMVVIEGSATLVTGGEVVDAHTRDNGEITGSAIRNGTRQSVSAGDVAHIPAGTPHQLLIAPGTSYKALVIKVRE